MEEEIKPKLSGVEIFFLVSFALIADLFNFLLVWVFLDWVVSILATGIFQLYFFIRGVKGKKYSLIGNVIDAIPFLSVLPAITGGVIGTVIADRRYAKRQSKMIKANSAKEGDLGYNYKEIDEYNVADNYLNQETENPNIREFQERHNARLQLKIKHQEEIDKAVAYYNSPLYKSYLKSVGKEGSTDVKERLDQEIARLKNLHQVEIDNLKKEQDKRMNPILEQSGKVDELKRAA